MVGRGNVVPIYREVRADLETPVSAFLKVARGDFAFLLESVEGGERLGRYSFIGAEPYRVLRCERSGGDPLAAVDEELQRFQAVDVPGLPRFHGGAVGYLGYEVSGHFERADRPGARHAGRAGIVADVHRRSARVRPPAAHDQGRRTRAPRWRHRRLVRAGRVEDRPAGEPAGAAAGGPALRAVPGAVRAGGAVELDAGRLPEGGGALQTVHPRRRRDPGGALAALLAAHRRAPIRGLPLAAGDQPVAVHVLPEVRRHLPGGRLAGAAGQHPGRPGGGAPDRGHAPAGSDRDGGRAAVPGAAPRPQGSWPSTSCCWTWGATMSGESARREP